MDVDLIFKIAAVGILVAVLNILLSRSGRDEQALMVTIAPLYQPMTLPRSFSSAMQSVMTPIVETLIRA